MDKRQRNIIIIVVAAMLLILFLLFQFGSRGSYSWSENYLVENRGPYGTDIIRQLLEDYYPNEDFTLMEDSINLSEENRKTPANYVFIGASQYLDSASISQLFDFIDDGNRAFIISRSLTEEVADYIYLYDCYGGYYWDGYEEFRDTAIDVSLTDQSVFSDESATHLSFRYRNQVRNYDWQYINERYLCEEEEEGIYPLGTFAGLYTNFVGIKYGNGYLYLHTNPLLFSNYALLEEGRLPYAEAIFSYTAAGPIYWDEYSKIPGFLRNPRFPKQISDRTPFDYILQQPPLAWAWYLLLAMAGLYLLFRTKRRQRIIPVLEKKPNTSLNFLQTIGHLYFTQNDHRKIALHKARLFLSFIRERYGLPTQELDDKFARQLSAKSEIPRKDIDAILLLNKNIQTSSFVSEKILVNFHYKIEAFYKNCK